MVFKKKPLKSSKVDPKTQFWNEVDSKARQLVQKVLAHQIVEEAYQDYLEEYQEEASQAEETRPSQVWVQELAYEYLLGLTRNILEELSQFSCHDFAYFEQLIQNE